MNNMPMTKGKSMDDEAIAMRLQLLMATNPQAFGYQMDDQSRQHRLDGSSANALAQYMNQRQGSEGLRKWLNYAQAGIGIPAGAAMTLSGDPMIGLPTLAWGGMGLKDATAAAEKQRALQEAAAMWGADPMGRGR